MTNRPVHEIRLGRVRASIWSNPGERGPMYSVSLCRLYTTDTCEWADSARFHRDDRLLIAKVADLAHS
ncbi:MAG: hypothetical protein U0871_01165 [Gemmataceae bacterium]